MGYRWYDQQNITPLFPFGYGLSYTQFDYSGLKIRPDSDGVEVSFQVENTGSVQGSEVPQVYVGAPANPPPSVQFAVQKLVGFQRVELDPGEGEQVSIHVSKRELSYWSTPAQSWVLPGGERKISVGASSRDIRLHGERKRGKRTRPRQRLRSSDTPPRQRAAVQARAKKGWRRACWWFD
jgi:beta-glucosidase